MPLPKAIPPRSVVTLVRADEKTPQWREQIGRRFRIGYYSEQDGLDCVWLVNDAGEYEQTIDNETLLRHFVVDELSKEADFFGRNRPKLGRLRQKTVPIERVQ
jgi:hypothetical protein